MAIIQCPGCGQEVSDKEGSCRYCGFSFHNPSCRSHQTKADMKRRHKITAFVLIGMAVLLSAIIILLITVILPFMDYQNAKKLLKDQEYVAAFAAFEELGNYKDAKKLAAEAQKNIRYTLSNETIISTKTGIGSRIIGFGEKNPYAWEVLTIEDGKALLLATSCIDHMPYHEQNTAVTWENCDLRKYLNEDFYETFSDEEKAMILPVENDNPDHAASGTPGGAKTTDKIFLLSLDEVEKYCSDNVELAEDRSWWLRSPGKDSAHAACVGTLGTVFEDGFSVVQSGNGVRPALWINISSTEDAEKIINDFDFTTKDGKTTIQFGGYTWRLLSIQSGEALFITDDIIEARAYHTTSETTWWSECNLRDYLNTEFYNRFSKQEKLKIAQTKISTPSNNMNYGGDPTYDKIFLLSAEEVETYFPEAYGEDVFGNKDRVAKYQNQPFWWWLRQPGYSHEQAIIVYDDGTIERYGVPIGDVLGVRPAMWLKLISTEPNPNPVSINEDFLADLGCSYGELRKKYGEITKEEHINVAIFWGFDHSPGMYYFESKNEYGEIPNDDDLCYGSLTDAKTLFGDFEGVKSISDVEKELGVSIKCFMDETINGYACTFDYHNYSIYINLGESDTMISEDNSVRVSLK